MKIRFPERLKKPGYRWLGLVVLICVVLTSPRWGRAILHELEYFRVHTLEIKGTIYLEPSDVVSRLRVDTLRSLFDDLSPLYERLSNHPQIASAKITRKPPGRLVVTVSENLPVALVPSEDGLQPFDSAGRALPIDPSRTDLDLPVIRGGGKAVASAELLNMLGLLRVQYPDIYTRISQVQRNRAGDVIFVLTPALRVRMHLGVAPERFRDIFPVEADLARRNERALELDLRFRDQVVARLARH